MEVDLDVLDDVIDRGRLEDDLDLVIFSGDFTAMAGDYR